MNAYVLMDTLRTQLAAHLTALPLAVRPVKGGQAECRAPAVHIGELPPKTGEEQVPFVLVQELRGDITAEGYIVHLGLRCAVWNSEEEGSLNDLHNLVSACLLFCARHREQPLGRRWLLTPDREGHLLVWKRPDDQAPNYAEAYILSRWFTKGL